MPGRQNVTAPRSLIRKLAARCPSADVESRAKVRGWLSEREEEGGTNAALLQIKNHQNKHRKPVLTGAGSL